MNDLFIFWLFCFFVLFVVCNAVPSMSDKSVQILALTADVKKNSDFIPHPVSCLSFFLFIFIFFICITPAY